MSARTAYLAGFLSSVAAFGVTAVVVFKLHEQCSERSARRQFDAWYEDQDFPRVVPG